MSGRKLLALSVAIPVLQVLVAGTLAVVLKHWLIPQLELPVMWMLLSVITIAMVLLLPMYVVHRITAYRPELASFANYYGWTWLVALAFMVVVLEKAF